MRATANLAAVREYAPAPEVLGRVLAANGAAAKTARAAKPVAIAKNVLLFAAAPFIGLAYAVAFPFVGIGALAWLAVRAAARRAARN